MQQSRSTIRTGEADVAQNYLRLVDLQQRALAQTVELNSKQHSIHRTEKQYPKVRNNTETHTKSYTMEISSPEKALICHNRGQM